MFKLQALLVSAFLGLIVLAVSGCKSETERRAEREDEARKGRAEWAATKTRIGMLTSALERYALDMQKYPTTSQGLEALVQKPDDSTGGSEWRGPYLSEGVPTDAWNRPFKYAYPATHNREKDSPEIWSLGPDGKDGTEDDITDWDQPGLSQKTGTARPREKQETGTAKPREKRAQSTL